MGLWVAVLEQGLNLLSLEFKAASHDPHPPRAQPVRVAHPMGDCSTGLHWPSPPHPSGPPKRCITPRENKLTFEVESTKKNVARKAMERNVRRIAAGWVSRLGKCSNQP